MTENKKDIVSDDGHIVHVRGRTYVAHPETGNVLVCAMDENPKNMIPHYPENMEIVEQHAGDVETFPSQSPDTIGNNTSRKMDPESLIPYVTPQDYVVHRESHISPALKNKIPNQNDKVVTSREKSRIPLVLSAGVAATMMATSLAMLPNPYNYIIAIAIAGPLSASLFGLKRKN